MIFLALGSRSTVYSERQRPHLQDQSFMNRFPEVMRGSVSPKVYRIVFVCNDLDDKGRLVIGVRKNRHRPIIVV